MKKLYLFFLIGILTSVIVIITADKQISSKKIKYPSEREFIQRTYPYYEYNPSVYVSAIEQNSIMKNALNKKYLAKGKSIPQWVFAGPVNISGRVVDIEFNPQNPEIVYAAAATGGVFKSTDMGVNWFPVFDDQAMLSIGDIAVDPVNPDVIYVGTGEANGGHNNFPGGGVYKSTDAGNSWFYIGLDSTASIGRIIINYNNPQEIYLAAVGSYFSPNPQRGVYKSTDGGISWNKSLFISDSTGAIDLLMHPANPNWLMASMWERVRRPNSSQLYGRTSGIYISTNGGGTWEKVPASAGLPDASAQKVGRIGLALCKTQPEIIYAYYNDGTTYSGLYKSTNSGINWIDADPDKEVEMGVSNFSWYFGQVRVHPANPDIVYAMDVAFMRSSNSGGTWTSNWGPHVDHHALAFNPDDPDYQILGNDGGIYVSTNSGITWSGPADLPITQFYEIGLDYQNPQRLYGGTQDNNTIRTLTGALDDWDRILGGDGFYVNVDPTNPNIIYAESQFGWMEKSTDGGFSWQFALNGINTNEDVNWSTPVIMCPFNNNVLYYGTDKIYRTTNGAANWTPISGDLTLGIPGTRLGTVTTIAVSPLDSNLIFAGTDDARAWMSTNYGVTWKNISNGLPDRWITRIVPDPNDIFNIYVTFSGLKWRDPQPHVFKSTDLGTTWTNISGNLPDLPVNAFAVDLKIPGRIYAGTDGGAYVSFNDGAEWEILGAGLPAVSVYDFKIHPTTNELVAGTHGRSMYKIDLDLLVGTEESESMVNTFRLDQNYPNPFNPSTSIKYSVSEYSQTELKVFDISGSLVASLVNEYNSPGEYEVTFNPEGRLSSGVYIYQIRSGGKNLSRKMLYLK